jgi:flagellar secretion chaperone FliS
MHHTEFNAYEVSAYNIVEDKGSILLKLYDGAIRFLSLAQKGITEKRVNVRGEKISQVMAIITELDCALDMEKGGELARNLGGLYRYMINRLTVANVQNDLQALLEVKKILETLKEGFEGAVAQEHSKRKASPPPASVYERSDSTQKGLRCAL